MFIRNQLQRTNSKHGNSGKFAMVTNPAITHKAIDELNKEELSKEEFNITCVPIKQNNIVIDSEKTEQNISVKDLVNKIEDKTINKTETPEIPESVKKTLNKLLFVTRYKNLK